RCGARRVVEPAAVRGGGRPRDVDRPRRFGCQVAEGAGEDARGDRAVGAVLAPADAGRKRVVDGDVVGDAGRDVGDDDREGRRVAGVDRSGIGRLDDLDFGAVDTHRGVGLVTAVVAGADGGGVVDGAAAVLGGLAVDVHVDALPGGEVVRAVAERAGGDRPAAVGVGGVDRPAGAGVGRQRVVAGHVAGDPGARVGERDREPDLVAGGDGRRVGELADRDLAAVDDHRGLVLAAAVVAGADGGGVVDGAAA